MIYSEPLINQISRFLSGIGFGFAVFALYMTIVFIRMIFGSGKIAFLIQDLVFGFLFTVSSFFFMIIHNNGEVRWNLVLAQLIGAAVLYFTIGKHLLKVLQKAADIIRKALKVLTTPLQLYLKAFCDCGLWIKNRIKKILFSASAKKSKEHNEKSTKNKGKKSKKPLKNQNKSV